ncbi:MAG: DUF4438 domain-containing protein [Deltaproteobacteria bacterium]|nr:DUF4438 domain-containing protein [Deltaproteobacteria bacterium]
MIRTNENQLVKIAIEGKVSPPSVWPNEVGHDGQVHNVPAVGGITYNVIVGDSAFGWAADHVEPGVSAIVNHEKRSEKPNVAFNFLACVGNDAIVISGEAKGKKGVVIGHHGGVEHVMIDFAEDVLEKLTNDDKFQIRAIGQGQKLLDYPQIRVSSLDPRLLQKMGIKEKKGKLEVPVAGIVPGKLMGSGLGSLNVHTGDYDIMTSDRDVLKKHQIDHLKLGDVIAITDIDASYGWRYLTGAVMIGVVIHGDSHASGHGPGVTSIMTSPAGDIIPVIAKDANIGKYLKLGRYR